MVRPAFGKLRPEVTYDVGEQKLSVTIAAYGHEAHADALDSLLALAEEVP